jgi:hypothetical protein
MCWWSQYRFRSDKICSTVKRIFVPINGSSFVYVCTRLYFVQRQSLFRLNPANGLSSRLPKKRMGIRLLIPQFTTSATHLHQTSFFHPPWTQCAACTRASPATKCALSRTTASSTDSARTIACVRTTLSAAGTRVSEPVPPSSRPTRSRRAPSAAAVRVKRMVEVLRFPAASET